MVAADSSTVCSSTRNASRAPETWLSAARVLLAVCWPLNSVCVTVAPTLRGALAPCDIGAYELVRRRRPAVLSVSVY